MSDTPRVVIKVFKSLGGWAFQVNRSLTSKVYNTFPAALKAAEKSRSLFNQPVRIRYPQTAPEQAWLRKHYAGLDA